MYSNTKKTEYFKWYLNILNESDVLIYFHFAIESNDFLETKFVRDIKENEDWVGWLAGRWNELFFYC